MVLPAGGTDRQASAEGRAGAGNRHSGGLALAQQVLVAGAASSQDRQADHSRAEGRPPSHHRSKHLFRIPAQSTGYLEDIRLALEDCKVSDEARTLMLTGTPRYSQWKSYKQWCVQQGRKIWTCSYFEDFKVELAADQLADYLGHIRDSPIAKVGGHGTLCNHRSAVNTAIMLVFKVCQSFR